MSRGAWGETEGRKERKGRGRKVERKKKREEAKKREKNGRGGREEEKKGEKERERNNLKRRAKSNSESEKMLLKVYQKTSHGIKHFGSHTKWYFQSSPEPPSELLACFPTLMLASGSEQADRASHYVRAEGGWPIFTPSYTADAIPLGSERNYDAGKASSLCTLPALHK